MADASLRRHRGVKLKADVAAGIPLYVIVNLVDDQVEVYRFTASGYGQPQLLRRAETLSLPTASSEIVAVAVDLLLT